ncbi:immunoglobulin-like domain-containing protein [Halomicrobium salinisoli]|uniref:immunoglobulin-like domain-containing protein n=1 Tax=Halomicrobium salinisoli TaxID=2878391 RepID=UPI001CF09253|nr:immunoglobulin-like domain-containing protein [Halomicrobium salinisoli]
MQRRTYLTSLALGSGGLVGWTVLGRLTDDTRPEYYGQEQIVDERDDLTISLREETVHLGDTVTFEVTNTGDSQLNLGCHNPWALQRKSNGDWGHVAWTSDRFHRLCLMRLEPDGTTVERVTLSRAALADQASTVEGDLSPGRYRFLLIGTSPYLALEFDVREATKGT